MEHSGLFLAPPTWQRHTGLQGGVWREERLGWVAFFFVLSLGLKCCEVWGIVTGLPLEKAEREWVLPTEYSDWHSS